MENLREELKGTFNEILEEWKDGQGKIILELTNEEEAINNIIDICKVFALECVGEDKPHSRLLVVDGKEVINEPISNDYYNQAKQEIRKRINEN